MGRTSFQRHMPTQLSLPFSWPASPANGGEKSKANGGGNRQRPDNDDDPFAKARGFIPPIGRPAYGNRGADYTKRVE